MKINDIFPIFALSTLLTSCQMYRTNFDCPIGEGVPCASVSEIQKMIIETPEGGEDIFLGKKRGSSYSNSNQKCSEKNLQFKKIWMEKSETECAKTEGFYIYFQDLIEETKQ